MKRKIIWISAGILVTVILSAFGYKYFHEIKPKKDAGKAAEIWYNQLVQTQKQALQELQQISQDISDGKTKNKDEALGTIISLRYGLGLSISKPKREIGERYKPAKIWGEDCLSTYYSTYDTEILKMMEKGNNNELAKEMTNAINKIQNMLSERYGITEEQIQDARNYIFP